MYRLRISEYSKLSYIINYERLLRLIHIFMKEIIKSNVALFKSVISMKDYENGNMGTGRLSAKYCLKKSSLHIHVY